MLKQRFYCRNKLVISSTLANISCADLGINVVFETLNTVLGTSYELMAPITSVLLSYIAQKADFGTVYAHLHWQWVQDFSAIASMETLSLLAQERERNALVDDRIKTRHVPPRRIWDLYANWVVPYWVVHSFPWGISRAWMDEKDLVDVWTPINRHEWPVPIPKDANLDLIRLRC